jgi:hypothetical protein
MYLYAQKCQICKNMQKKLHICNIDFMNQIYIPLRCNSGCAKKICQVMNIQALVISIHKQIKMIKKPLLFKKYFQNFM